MLLPTADGEGVGVDDAGRRRDVAGASGIALASVEAEMGGEGSEKGLVNLFSAAGGRARGSQGSTREDVRCPGQRKLGPNLGKDGSSRTRRSKCIASLGASQRSDVPIGPL
jgi:hypothetical protein